MAYRLPPVVERLLIAAALGVVFVVTASVIVPDWSRADPPGEEGPALPSLGTLETVRYRIEMHGSPYEPLYSVHDAQTGVSLGAGMTADELAARFPDLDLRPVDFSADSDAPYLLMLHTED